MEEIRHETFGSLELDGCPAIRPSLERLLYRALLQKSPIKETKSDSIKETPYKRDSLDLDV